MMEIFNKTLDEERALYGCRGIYVKNCNFDGPADGESAIKECRDATVEDCFFNLRYPFWHDDGLIIRNSELTELCRAAIWYSRGIEITSTKLHGIKAIRECSDVILKDCDIISPEFGWNTHNVKVSDSTAEGEYIFMNSTELELHNFKINGKYSFQYIKNAVLDNCILHTKDTLWHAENVTVRNSVIKGEYLAWYSNGLTLENCKIIGTQPLCYCKNLKLINCTMEDADLAFEYSDVEADVRGNIVSVKNPKSGFVTADSIGEIILKDSVIPCDCKITVR